MKKYGICLMTCLLMASATAFGAKNLVHRGMRDGMITRNYSVGGNGYGQLSEYITDISLGGAGSTIQPVTAAAGYSHSAVIQIDSNGQYSLYTTGLNNYGQLGLGNAIDRTEYAKVAGFAAGEHPVAVSAGYYHTMVITQDNSGNRYLYGTGYNGSGELGLGNTANRSVFAKVTAGFGAGEQPLVVSAGHFHTMVITQNKAGVLRLYGTGHNGAGQLGLGDTTNRLVFTPVTPNLVTGDVFVNVACGGAHSMIITQNMSTAARSLYATGDNSHGQLGRGAVDVGLTEFGIVSPATFVYDAESDLVEPITREPWSVSAGAQHTLLVVKSTDATATQLNVFATGYNTYGQLGIASNIDTSVFTQESTGLVKDAKEVYAGYYHSMYLTTAGGLWGAGLNKNDQIGNNTIPSTDSNIFVSSGNIADPQVALADVFAVAAGGAHTLALIEKTATSNTLWVAGLNAYGQLGTGDKVSTSDLPIKGFRQPSGSIGFGFNPDVVAEGYYHSMMIVTNDTPAENLLYGTGYNGYGQLGLAVATPSYSNLTKVTLPTGVTTPTAVSCGYYHTLLIAANSGDKLYVTGNNSFGQLGNASTTDLGVFTTIAGIVPTKISAGYYHSLVATADLAGAGLYVAGRNTEGQLGIGPVNITDQNTFKSLTAQTSAVIPPWTGAITEMAAGGYHSLVIADGKLYGTGTSLYGQLGMSSVTSRNTFYQIQAGSSSFVGTPVKIAAGGFHSLLITALNGKYFLYATGWNGCGQLGLGDTNNRNVFTLVTAGVSPMEEPVDVSAGDAYSLLITRNSISGEYFIYGAGRNVEAQLGLGDSANRTIFTKLLVLNPNGQPMPTALGSASAGVQIMRNLLLYSRLLAADLNNL